MIKATDKIAIICGDKQVSFKDMLRYITVYSHHTAKEEGARTLIVSENREGWLYAMYSIWVNQGIVVPVDAGSTVHDIEYIINDAKPQGIWTSVARKPLVEEALKNLGLDIHVELVDDYENADISSEEMAKLEMPKEKTGLICYTSGTTGSPKGVMLTFGNMLANVVGVSEDVPIFRPELRSLILLPLHHVLPLMGCGVAPMLTQGGVAICPTLAAKDIMDTLQRGQIGIMIGVPRLWQTLYKGIKGKIDAHWITRQLFNLCSALQWRWLSRLVFKSVRTAMGGHITFCVSGGAALDKDIAVGLKTLGLDLLEGYGMTETSPIIAFTRPGDIIPGCVGKALPCSEVKLVDGELCARGPQLMRGYYNRPEETAAVIDEDGYIHTGDLATIDDNGHITITGRKKEIIVLSNGKNINPSEVEFKIERYDTIVKEAAVTQDGDMLKAIIVPQPAWADGKTDDEMEEVIKKEVLQPYNLTVAPYKKVMSLMIYHGELPRTRMEKLQRYKLKDILVEGRKTAKEEKKAEVIDDGPSFPEYQIIRKYLMEEKHCAVKPTDNLETDLALDSLDKVTLQGFIEQTFGMKLDADMLAASANVLQLAELVAEYKTQISVEKIDWHTLLNKPQKQASEMHKMAFTGIWFVRTFKAFAHLMLKLEIKGKENIPVGKAFIMTPNHQSMMDAPLVMAELESSIIRNTYSYAKKDHVRGPFLRMLAHSHNIVIMDMSTLKDSIQTLGNVLNDGKNILIFPEGTRTRDGQLGEFKKTFAILSKELDIPIVPVVIKGAYESMPRGRFLPRPHKVVVEYLPAIMPKQGEEYTALSDRVSEAIEQAMKN